MRIAITAIAASVILFLLTASSFAQETEQSEVVVGKIAPNFAGTDIYGKRIELQEFRGKVVIITVGKTRGPSTSEEERNKLKKFYDDHHPQGLDIIRIVYKSGIPFFITKSYVENRAKESLARRKTSWTLIVDWDCSLKELFRVSEEPLALVLDKQGIIKYKKNEELTANSSLEELIEKLLIE